MSSNAGSPGVPGWVVTFADLMSLMMTFFVLLFSFSSMDEQKYRQIVESLAAGFGAEVVRKSNSTPVTVAPPAIVPSNFTQLTRSNARPNATRSRTADTEEIRRQSLATQVTESMRPEIAAGMVAVEMQGNAVVIRLPEEIAFPPGSDEVSAQIAPVLKRVAASLADTRGMIVVSGHTDDRPITSGRFRSNWELSTDRAVSVVEQLVEIGGIAPERVMAVGHAATRPLAPNDSDGNRARNRRVEISIVQE